MIEEKGALGAQAYQHRLWQHDCRRPHHRHCQPGMIQEARDRKRVIDATQGRRTRAVIQTDSDHVVLSAIQPETIAGRVGQRDAAIRDEEKEV